MRSAMGAKLQLYSIRLPCTRMVLVPALYTAAAAVQECCQIADLRFSCGPAQDRLALRRSCCQKQGLGSTHAGEPKCDVRTVQPGRRCQDQPCPLLPAVHAICARPERCRSTGLAPMRHPPGNTVSTRQAAPEAVRRTKWMPASARRPSGARRQVEGTPCTVMSLPCQRAVQPAPCKSSTLVSTSARCGTCRKRTVPLHKRPLPAAAARCFWLPGCVLCRSAACRL